MSAYALKEKESTQKPSVRSPVQSGARYGGGHDMRPIPLVRSTLGVDFDLGRIPVSRLNAGEIQTKLAIGKPGDEYEQEADRA